MDLGAPAPPRLGRWELRWLPGNIPSFPGEQGCPETAKTAAKLLELSAPGPAAVAAGAAAASTPAAAAPSSLEPGKGLGSLPEMSFLSPRGKFGVKLCESALVLQGKAASVVVPYASIESMWAVPEVDERGFLFACSLSAPVAHGKSQLSGLSFITKPTDKEASLTLPGKAAAKGSDIFR